MKMRFGPQLRRKWQGLPQRAAPVETPMVKGSASGFCKMPWNHAAGNGQGCAYQPGHAGSGARRRSTTMVCIAGGQCRTVFAAEKGGHHIAGGNGKRPGEAGPQQGRRTGGKQNNGGNCKERAAVVGYGQEGLGGSTPTLVLNVSVAAWRFSGGQSRWRPHCPFPLCP